MSFLIEVLRETWSVIAEAAPWLFIGFLFAGLLKAFVPSHRIARSLGANSARSVWLAALWGAPIPLCSCSVIPTATALHKSGASKGATASFLISTPETGVDSISVTYALLDPIMTVLRPLSALLSAILTGSAVNWLVQRGWEGPVASDEPTRTEGSCCSVETDASGGQDGHDHGSASSTPKAQGGVGSRVRSGVRYAFIDLFDDLTPVLALGLLLSGLISALIPAEFFREVGLSGWKAMWLMLAIGTPLYVCATASTPIAAALIAKGLNPGAALVFLLVGPATNITTLLVVGRMLGRRILAAYLTGVVAVALAVGFAADVLYSRMGIDLGAAVAATLHEGPSPLTSAAGVALLVLLGLSAIRIRMDRILVRWVRAPLGWLRRLPRGGALLWLLGAGILWFALAGLSACRTTEVERSTNSGLRTIPRAQPSLAWSVSLDGEQFGRVVRFDVAQQPSQTRFVVQNPFGQDLGLIDSLGRAFRFEPHQKPTWVGTGSIEEGVAAILSLTGNLRLQEVALSELETDPRAPQARAAGAPREAPGRD